MKNFLKLPVLLFLLLSAATGFSQEKFTLSGHIRDATNGEELIGANIYVEELGTGSSTNVYGFYSLSLDPENYKIVISYLGYQSLTKEISLSESQVFDIELQPEGVMVVEVVVTAKEEDKNVKNVEMSVENLSAVQIKKIPQVMGEADLIRSIQLLPGVSTVGEGATGFNVRGGNVDQNLILLDEATVYNSSHLFGLFSVFNVDAIKDSKLYKGGIPAKYGGRLSSVLDVRQRDGNRKNFAANGGIGLIASRLTLEGPIQKDKSSFMVAGRSSYGHLFLKLDPELKDNVVYFYDLNAKANFYLSDKDRIFLSGYFGRDVFNFGDAFSSDWGNATATVRWNHLFSDKLFSNFTAIYSDYGYSFGVPEGTQAFDWDAHIFNYVLKGDFTYFFNPKSQLDFGVESNLYRFHPGNAKGIGSESIFNEIDIQHKHAWEAAVYASYEHEPIRNLTLQYGLRFSSFTRLGKEDVYLYENGDPTSKEAIIDTVSYGAFEKIASFSAPEPRFSANYLINDQNSVKLSYNRMRQYIHLVSNTTSATPIDIWTPSDQYIDPATVDQVAVGYFRNFKNNTYEASIEGFYKYFDNLMDYKDGAELLLNETLETELLSGEGQAYGLELAIRKNKGAVTGWVSYTLSRSERKVPGINDGEYYPANYDKTHDLSVTASWQINERFNFSANFAYASGRPITYPESRYVYDGITVPHYGNRNGARTPDYHRMDVGLQYTPNKNPNKRWKSSWEIGAYNVYARRNAYSIFFRQNEDNPLETEAVRLSIFGNILPYVTYNFSF
ncbi:MAG: collagen-binding protein [Saprospiraceae bacterium]|nr:MAG: collagen-binding protein [Saprospiraceae bacterium]